MRYKSTNTNFLDVIIALWSKTKRQVKKQGKMERDKFPSLKFKCYLFSSADVKQRQDQRYLPVEEKKYVSSPGPPTYASSLTTKRKPYGRKIKPADFFKRLEQAKQSFKWKCDKEGEETTLSRTRSPDQAVLEAMELSRRRWSPWRRRDSRNQSRIGSLSKKTKDMPSKRAWEFPEKTERSLQRKTQSRRSWWNGGQGTPRTRQVNVTETPK